MAQLPFVSDVFENFKVQIPKPQRAVALSAAAAAPGEAWHLAKIGAPQAWAAGFKGQGVRIGHLDSGVDARHPQLDGRIQAFMEFNASVTVSIVSRTTPPITVPIRPAYWSEAPWELHLMQGSSARWCCRTTRAPSRR